MCCNKRRQNAYGNYANYANYGNYGRYGSCGSRYRSNAASNIGAVIGAFQQIRLDSRQPQQLLPQTSQMPRELDGQTQGVVYPSVLDEKSAPQQITTVNEEQLPSYEESTKPLNRSVSAPATRPETQPTSVLAIQQQESSNRVVALGLQHFNAGLEAYRLGDRKSAKKAARSFIRDLYDQEMERRRSDKGYLECGERKEIKRELQPLKQMMKEAVREAKVERRMQRV